MYTNILTKQAYELEAGMHIAGVGIVIGALSFGFSTLLYLLMLDGQFIIVDCPAHICFTINF